MYKIDDDDGDNKESYTSKLFIVVFIIINNRLFKII